MTTDGRGCGPIGAWLTKQEDSGRNAVVTCSALGRVYRDLLREGRPDVRFCHVEADAALIKDRVEHRAGHYMPVGARNSAHGR
jgi:gluconokinase